MGTLQKTTAKFNKHGYINPKFLTKVIAGELHSPTRVTDLMILLLTLIPEAKMTWPLVECLDTHHQPKS